MFQAISWGAGLQSTVLAAMSALGDLPKVDLVIHADTGWERQATIDMRDWYKAWLEDRGLQVVVLSTGNIRQLAAKEHVHIPFWTSDGGPLRRQCTRHFKMDPIKRYIRQALGYHPSKAPSPKPGSVETWLGITVDEWTRAKASRVKYITNRWPLLELKMDRVACRRWLEDHGLPVPPKSACVCCPYRRASEWLEMKEQAPEEWQAACDFDNTNRYNPLLERGGSTADEVYLWRESEPLDQADLVAAARREQQRYGIQLPMFACESGYCGI